MREPTATTPTPPVAPRLALRPREAATALGIGTRTLWLLTNSGQIPHTRLGRCVVYPVRALEEWLAKQAQQNYRPSD